jgi:hypothetical protein
MNRRALQGARFVQQIDRTPVGQPRHDEAGQVAQRRVVVQRGAERRARIRQQPGGLFGALQIADVDGRAHDPRGGSVGGAVDGAAALHPTNLAIGGVQPVFGEVRP